MPLIPDDTLRIDSPLPVAQARARLEQATGPRPWLGVRWPGMGASSHPFVGEVSGDEVRIERAIGYQNPFLPRIQARLEPRAEGCRLEGTLSLHPPTGVFMLVWFAVVLLGGLVTVVLDLAQGELSQGTMVVMGMLIAGWTVVWGSFAIEARIARKRLAALLDGGCLAQG